MTFLLTFLTMKLFDCSLRNQCFNYLNNCVFNRFDQLLSRMGKKSITQRTVTIDFELLKRPFYCFQTISELKMST